MAIVALASGHELLLDDLSAEQRDAVTVEAAALVVSASPGAGKTRVLTRRIAYRSMIGAAPAEHVLGLTFTRAAALELRVRLHGAGIDNVSTGTLHGTCLSLLAQRYADGRGTAPNLVISRERLCRDVLAALGEDRVSARSLDTEIGWANAHLSDPASYAAQVVELRRSLPVGAETMADLLVAYNRAKRQRRVIDFDDLLSGVRDAFTEDPAWAEAMRWKYRHIYVDEYQDTSLLQLSVLTALTGPDADICVVGDEEQSIFGFAGSQPDAFDHFRAVYPEAAAVRLATNHRSARVVVAAATSLIPSSMTPRRDAEAGTIEIRQFDDEDAEAIAVARLLQARSRPWSDRAVLGRTYAALDPVEAACRELGIPTYRPRGLLQRPEIRHIRRELQRQPGMIPAASLHFDVNEIEHEMFADPSAVDEDDADTRWEPERPTLAEQQARHYINELRELLDEFGDRVHGTADEFWRWVEAVDREQLSIRPVSGAVALRTVHRAKGLEWRDVYVVGCTDTSFPLRHADPDEELRLMYVAVTRTRENLVCTWSATGTDRRGRTVQQGPSPYFAQLEAAILGSRLQLAEEMSRQAAASLRAREEIRAFLQSQRPVVT